MPYKPMTMADGMQEIMGLLGQMLLAPDADQQFIMDMQHVITAKANSPQSNGVDAQGNPMTGPGAGTGAGPAGPNGPMGDPNAGGAAGPVAGPGPASPPPQQGQMPPQGMAGPAGPLGPDAGAGATARPSMPNPDELRRVLAERTGK